MATPGSIDLKQVKGPSGFIELNGSMLVVDYGKVYEETAPVGFLLEDGLLLNSAGPLGQSDKPRMIDEIPGCIFRGIDASGLSLELPGLRVGPTGSLTYHGLPFNVVNGRICDADHRFRGEMDDAGSITVRDAALPDGFRKLDENSQLLTVFDGQKSTGEPFKYEFARPLYRKDRPYSVNEVIRYFQGFDSLSGVQKKYVLETMSLWSSAGLVQIVRKSEGDCSLGNVRHGAAGVTGVRTGNVTLDKEEFEREIELYKQFGALAVVSKGIKTFTEVRVNLVVAHEFGHQLEFCVTKATQEKITDLYEQRKRTCDKLHPLPANYSGFSELLEPQQVMQRHFLSGYAKTSVHEFWAECVAAFSVKESREKLKEFDPAISKLLTDLVMDPTSLLRLPLHKSILDIQAGLRLGGEFNNDLLAK
jgi:hypothetical protein